MSKPPHLFPIGEKQSCWAVNRTEANQVDDSTYTGTQPFYRIILTEANRVELQNSDLLSVTYSKNYEFLPAPFAVAPGVRIPVGGYDFASVLAAYNPGQQRIVSGSGSLEIGSFYNGDKTTAAFRGRVSLTPRLAVEPNISLNWIDLPQQSFTNTVVGQRTLYSMTPRMFIAALVQYASGFVSSNVAMPGELGAQASSTWTVWV